MQMFKKLESYSRNPEVLNIKSVSGVLEENYERIRHFLKTQANDLPNCVDLIRLTSSEYKDQLRSDIESMIETSGVALTSTGSDHNLIYCTISQSYLDSNNSYISDEHSDDNDYDYLHSRLSPPDFCYMKLD